MSYSEDDLLTDLVALRVAANEVQARVGDVVRNLTTKDSNDMDELRARYKETIVKYRLELTSDLDRIVTRLNDIKDISERTNKFIGGTDVL